MRDAFSNLPAGINLTEEMAAFEGLTLENEQLGRRHQKAMKFLDMIPENDRDFSFLRDLFQ